MKYLLISMCLSFVSLSAQPTHKDLLEIKIAKDSLKVSVDNPEITLTLDCKNTSRKNLLLYGFGTSVFQISPTINIDRACDIKHVSGGMMLLVFKSDFKPKYAHWKMTEGINYNMNEQKLKDAIVESRVDYLMNTKILEKSSVTSIDKKIDLRNFELEKGTYHLQVVYYAGKKLMDEETVINEDIRFKSAVGKGRIERDEKENHAKLYQGCATSNMISFTVE